MDCRTNKTIGWVIGDRSIKTAKKLYEKLKHLDAVFYVDDWDPYKQIFPKNKLVIGKKHTTLIESNNSNIRHFLARIMSLTLQSFEILQFQNDKKNKGCFKICRNGRLDFKIMLEHKRE